MAKKLLPVISVLMIVAFALVACAKPTAAPTAVATEAPAEVVVTEAPTEAPLMGNVVIWHSKQDAENEALNQIIELFKAANPDVTVESLFVPDNDLRNKFETAAATGTGPTVLFAHADWGAPSYDAALIQDISTMVTPGLLDTLNPAAVASVMYKDAVLGFPINVKGVLMFRNSAIVAEAATDWDDLIAKATAATAGDVYGLDFESGLFFAAGHLTALGGNLLDATTGAPLFNDAKGVEWLTRIKSVKDAGLPVENNNDNDVNLFKAGKAGIIIDGLWNASALADAIGAENLVIDAWPAGMSGYVQSDHMYLSTAATGDDAKASEAFMEFFVGAEAQKIWADVSGGIPANTMVEITDPIAKAAMEAFKGGVAFPVIPQMSQYWDPANNAILAVLDKGSDPAAALQDAYDTITKALAQ
jgi:arabinogalactan oligomer/maltooligosaccharide transport system substrate-binding protein